MSTVHQLKCWPIPFAAMRDGTKRFEYRKDDRNYQVGDVLHVNEWKPDNGPGMGAFGQYTGEGDRYRVTYKLAGRFGVPDGFCVLSIEPLAPHPDLAGVEVVNRDDAIERLAALEHQQWMAWASTVAEKEPISDERRARWMSCMVPYSQLSEEMKEHDRVWARKALGLLGRGMQ